MRGFTRVIKGIIVFCLCVALLPGLMVAPAARAAPAGQGAAIQSADSAVGPLQVCLSPYFYLVYPVTYDSDSDGYDDSVHLYIDADPSEEYGETWVTCRGGLYDPGGHLVDWDEDTWYIHAWDVEYGNLDLTNDESSPASCNYYLWLWETEWGPEQWQDTWFDADCM